MIAIVHSIYSQSVHTPALNAGLMDNDAGRCCMMSHYTALIKCITSNEIICESMNLSRFF